MAALDTDPSLSLALAGRGSQSFSDRGIIRLPPVGRSLSQRGRVVVGGAPPARDPVYYTVSRYSPDRKACYATGSLEHGQVRPMGGGGAERPWPPSTDTLWIQLRKRRFQPGQHVAGERGCGRRILYACGGFRRTEDRRAGRTPGTLREPPFGPGGKFILTTGEDDSARLWDPMTGRLGCVEQPARDVDVGCRGLRRARWSSRWRIATISRVCGTNQEPV